MIAWEQTENDVFCWSYIASSQTSTRQNVVSVDIFCKFVSLTGIDSFVIDWLIIAARVHAKQQRVTDLQWVVGIVLQ